MRSTWIRTILFAAALHLGGMRGNDGVQAVPWDIFDDPNSTSTCDAVNASNAELVVLSGTGELVIITGTDLILTATFVDADGFVFFDGLAVGVINFAEDGDGIRTLWWTSLDGTVVEVDAFTGEPSTTNLLPSDFHGVLCDACEIWDNLADCVGDQDGDGIVDVIDICPDTPPDEPVDIDGCSCSQFDDDADGVDNCVDDCPDTPLGEAVDDGGCACFEVDSDADGIDDCTDDCPFTPPDELVDAGGCSCSEFDDDADGVENCFDDCPDTPLNSTVDDAGCPCVDDSDVDGVEDCFDDCPGTPLNADVDAHGCEIVVVMPPPPVFISCGGFSGLTVMLTFGALVTLRLARRKW